MLVTVGSPCGPCFGIHKSMYLRKGTLLIALFEIFFSCIVVGACLGTFVSLRLNSSELKDAELYDSDDVYWLSFACVWQSCCYILFLLLGHVLLYTHLNRESVFCKIWIGGVIISQIMSIVGIGFTLMTLFVFDVLIVLLFVRIYFIWVVLAYYLEIKLYPDGFPPPLEPVIVVKEPEPEPKNKESSIHYVGDG